MKLHLAALLALLLVPSLALAEGRKTSAAWDGDELKITARIEFYGQVLRPQVEAWQKGIEKVWNRDSFADVDDKDGKMRHLHVVIALETHVRKADDAPREGWHQIRVVSGLSEFVHQRLMKEKGKLVDGYRSWCFLGGAEEGDSGCWSNLIWSTVAAHEFGHILGLDDEYHEKAAWYVRPILGFLEDSPPSIMNLSWFPGAVAKPRHFEKIVENATKNGWLKK